MGAQDTLSLSNINESAVYRMRLVWPDTFSQGPDGGIYVTASHINDSPQYNMGRSTRTMPYAVFEFKP